MDLKDMKFDNTDPRPGFPERTKHTKMNTIVDVIFILCALGMLFNISIGVELLCLDMGGPALFKIGTLTNWDFKTYTYISSLGWFLTFVCYLYFQRNPPGDDNILDS